MKGRSTEIYSIFGQIDSVIAQAMVDEGKANKIEQAMIPPTALFDDKGNKAFFAIVLPTEHLAEYHRRVKDLYA